MHALVELVKEGKIRHMGLGEVGAENIRRAHKIHPVTAIQAEYSLFFREHEKCLIPLCRELGIGLVACAPLCRGLLTGSVASFDGLQVNDFRRCFPRFSQTNLPHNLKIVEDLRKIAKKKSGSLSQLALGWLSSQPSSIVPIFGTTHSPHLIENISPMNFSASDIREINEVMAQANIQGDRLTDAARPLYRTN
jgi:aryl-alcohol dehydrogenase-like predicted oxidoreductase